MGGSDERRLEYFFNHTQERKAPNFPCSLVTCGCVVLFSQIFQILPLTLLACIREVTCTTSAAKNRAAADASPDVLDVERPRYERRLIAREIQLSHEVFRQLPAEATVMIFGTSRFPVGEVSWTIVEEEMWKEAVLSFYRRGYGYPSLLHDDGTCIGEVELKRAGAQMELLYLSDRITDATGNVESGEGAVEGHLIRMIENAHGCTDAMRAITHLPLQGML
jgi:hypothetical protein